MASFIGSGEFSGTLHGSYSVCPDSVLEIADGCSSHRLRVDIGGSRVTIGRDCVLKCLEIYARGSEICIGDGTGFTWNAQVLSHEPSRITIGRGCLIASDVMVVTSDMHSIVDVRTGKRVNQPGAVEIGDHVWLAQAAYVLKGVRIGEGSIIGAASVVTRDIPANSLAVGIPARVIRESVTWRHELS